MTTPNSNYSELLSLTVQELEDELFDQIAKKNATTALLKAKGMISPKDGGPKIVIPIMWAENGSYKRYSGAEQLNTSQTDVFTAFEYPWKQIAINIQAHGLEMLQNMGRSQRRDLVKSRVLNAKSSFENNFNSDLLSDGTASNQINGLQALISANGSGTVAGVSRSSYSFAQNQYYRASTDGGAVLSASNITIYMDRLDIRIQSYKGSTDLILADDNCYAFFEQTVHPLQRITNQDGTLAQFGFKTYRYKNAEVVLEPQIAGMPANTMYFIDSEVLELCPHSDRNLTRLPKRESWNQDAFIEYMAWCGNLCAKNFRRLGTLNNN